MTQPQQHPLGGTPAQLAGRLLFAVIFFASAMNKFQTFDKSTGGPMTAYMTPKLDNALNKFQTLTGFTLPIEKVGI